MPLKRPCTRCQKSFLPTGRNNKVCEDCNKLSIKRKANRKKRKYSEQTRERLKITYFASKEELDILRDNITLEKWKVLSKAYKMGKKIWGTNFNKVKLANDMDMPFTTVLRCLSLDRCNKRTWRLIREKKISVFKVAQVCMSKNKIFQDKVIDMIIKDNLSTYQISSLRVGDIEDINKERHRLAVEKGYSREDSAYSNFSNWIGRGKLFLLINPEKLPEKKLKDIKDGLEDLDKRIKNYLGGI